ncbi:MAG: TetR family transcriptional regulator C-terminal domain-containing protein [Halohasta sp.]
MGLGELFDEPTDTREELMGATYRALCEHGYAELTIQRISDQFPKSKSLLYHHYDSKDELLLDFLSYLLDHFESTMPRADDEAAVALAALLDHVLPTDPDPERRQFIAAIIELRAQAATDPAYRAHFTRSTAFLHDAFVRIIETGVAEGTFRPVDADRVASLLVATIEGAMVQQVTIDTEMASTRSGELRAELDSYIERQLLTVDGEGE